MTSIKTSFRINLNILETFGLYAPEKITRFYHVRSWLMYFVFSYPVPVLGTLYLVLEKEIDPLRFGDDAFLVAEIFWCQIIKFLPFLLNKNRMKNCIHYLENPIFAAKNEQDKEILTKCTKTCQRNSKVFLISVIGGLISWAVRPFFEEERRLPLDVWLPFSLIDANIMYFSTFLFIVVAVAYGAVAGAVIDPLVGGLACLTAGQIQILKKNLQNLNNDGEKILIKNQIKRCVQLYNAILLFVNEYEKCFSLSITSQFAGSVLVICFCCLELSKVSPMTVNFMSTVACLGVFLVQIYFYCYYGTIVYEEVATRKFYMVKIIFSMFQSNTLIDAIYLSTWYECDTDTKKDLILLMERSKRPIIITVGKILELSVITFTGILKKSYSLLAVLENR